MQHSVWQIQKERLLLVPFYKGDGFIGIKFGELRRVNDPLDHGVITHQRHSAVAFKINHFHRIEIMQESKIGIESPAAREELRFETEMPFPNAGGGVPIGF